MKIYMMIFNQMKLILIKMKKHYNYQKILMNKILSLERILDLLLKSI